MRATAHLAIKGVSYYDAVALFKRGVLTPGLPIQLKHEADNPHDNNAIAVRLKSSGEMLGHLSKELAPKYAALVDHGRVLEACINGIEKNGKYLNIEIKVVYEQPDKELTARHTSRLWASSAAIPEGPGVYAIRNIRSGRQYIGSSINLRSRIRSHIKDLLAGCHANHALQSDFSALGANNFEAKTLANDVPQSRLNLIETQHIRLFLDSGDALYNLTFDGRGAGHKLRGLVRPQPISDQLANRRAEDERLRIEQIRTRKKEAVVNTFDKKLAQLVPQSEFSRYFFASFFCSFAVLAILFPGIGASGVLIISLIMALFASLTINSHYQEKAKKSPRYQDLLKERDNALRKIDNDLT
jgi:group I intron endonuclease